MFTGRSHGTNSHETAHLYVLPVSSSIIVATPSTEAPGLSTQELAVLGALVACAGRVVSRHELARRSGLTDRSERRCDAILVQLRRHLGTNAIRTVRSRGWLLAQESVSTAQTLISG